MRRDPREVQKRDGIQIGGRDERFDLVHEILIVCLCDILAQSITRSDLLDCFIGLCPAYKMIGVFRRSGIQLKDGGGIENEYSRTIRYQPQVDAIGLIILNVLFVIHTRGERFNLRETVCETVDEFHNLSSKFTASIRLNAQTLR